jgi:hypothetical protein
VNAMTTDTNSIFAIQPLELVAYLRSFGWKQVKEKPGNWSIWTQTDADRNEYEIGVPLSRSLRDYRSRMSEVLGVLEAAESRSRHQILRDLLVIGADVIRLRLPDPDLKDATIPLEEGAIFIQKAKELMLCAASAVVMPKMYYPGRRPKLAVDYMRRARLGQTEPGSFVVTIVSPVSPSLNDPHGQAWASEEPFERKVTSTLAIALSSVKQAAAEAAASGKIDSFVDAVDKGVSANLCDALAKMSIFSDADRTIDVAFSWSRSRPVLPEHNLPDRICLGRDVFPIIQEAAKYLKETSPREDFHLQGFVVTLNRPEQSNTGTATIHGLIDKGLRKVALTLSRADYARAVRAHENRRRVSCTGVLVREGQSFALHDPFNFTVHEDDDQTERS